MVDAMRTLVDSGVWKEYPITDFLAATSVGVVSEGAVLDLNYKEDSSAIVDMNVIMTGAGKYVELQGTGEESPFSNDQLIELLGLAQKGINDLIMLQKEILGDIKLSKAE